MAARKNRPGGPPSYSPEARVARKLGQVVLRLTPEEADAFRAWAAEHGGLAALVRWLLAERQAR